MRGAPLRGGAAPNMRPNMLVGAKNGGAVARLEEKTQQREHRTGDRGPMPLACGRATGVFNAASLQPTSLAGSTGERSATGSTAPLPFRPVKRRPRSGRHRQGRTSGACRYARRRRRRRHSRGTHARVAAASPAAPPRTPTCVGRWRCRRTAPRTRRSRQPRASDAQ